MTDTTPPVFLTLRGKLDEAAERLALRSALAASHLLGLATGMHLRKLRDMNDPLAIAQARIEEAELRVRLALEAAEILRARFAKIPERNRPYYTPAQRFRILEIRTLLAWNAPDTARAFLVCPNTILNWEQAADPDTHSVGSTVKPTPPVRRAADVVRSLVGLMDRLGFGGPDLISRILARAGWRVSARSVGRYRRRNPLAPPKPASDAAQPKRPYRPVIARFVHHVWMLDVSLVRQFLGPDLYMAAVFDAFSRAPLALQVFEAKPGTRDMARLLRRAARAFAKPKYVITDLGGEFTGGAFRNAVKRLGAVQRFASADSLYATARLERFWLTLKQDASLYRLQLPLTAQDLERRLELTLFHYVVFRPHEGLQGATPAEALLSLEPACEKTVEAPRGRPGEGIAEPPFQVEHFGDRFPLLAPTQ